MMTKEFSPFRVKNQNFTTRFESLISLPLHSSTPIEPNFYCLFNWNTLLNIVCGICVMQWPLHCKIREEPIHQNRNFTKYPFKKRHTALRIDLVVLHDCKDKE